MLLNPLPAPAWPSPDAPPDRQAMGAGPRWAGVPKLASDVAGLIALAIGIGVVGGHAIAAVALALAAAGTQ